MHRGHMPLGETIKPSDPASQTTFYTRQEADFVELECRFMLVKAMATSPTDILDEYNTTPPSI